MRSGSNTVELVFTRSNGIGILLGKHEHSMRLSHINTLARHVFLRYDSLVADP